MVLVLELLLGVVGVATAGAAVGKKGGSDAPHLWGKFCKQKMVGTSESDPPLVKRHQASICVHE